MRTLILLTLLLYAGVPANYAQGVSDSDISSKIVALENLWNQAARAKDLEALNRLLDDAFIYVDADGKLRTKAEVLANVRDSQGIRVTSDTMVVHVHGDIAVVTGIYNISGIEHGKPFLLRERFVDTWRFKKGSWTSIASLTTPIVP